MSRASRVRRTWEETSASRGGRRKVQGAPAQYVLARRVMRRWSAKAGAGERGGPSPPPPRDEEHREPEEREPEQGHGGGAGRWSAKPRSGPTIGGPWLGRARA